MDGWMDGGGMDDRTKVSLGAGQTELEPKGPDSQPRCFLPPPRVPGGS